MKKCYWLFIPAVFLLSACTVNSYIRGIESFNRQKFSEATRELQDYIDNNADAKETPAACLGIAWNYYCQGDYFNAISNASILINTYPRDNAVPWAYIIMAHAHIKQGDEEKGIELFNQIFMQHRDTVWGEEALFQIGELKYKNYDYRGAIKSFFNLVMAYPQSEYTAKAYYEIGDSYYKLRDYRKALSNYVTVIENFPEYPETPIALYRVAVYHESRGFMDDAVKYLKILAEKYPLSPEAPRAYMKIASFLFDAKNSKEGMAWYEQAIARYPESEFVDLAWYSLGLLNFNQGVFNNSKYLDAEKYLVKFENGFASSIYREKAMELLIEVYRKTGDFKKLDQLSVFFAVQYPKSKKSVEILFNLAVDFYEKKNYDKASEYSRGLLDNPQLETEKMRRIAQLYIDIHKSHLKDGKKLFSGYKAFFNTMPGDEEALPLLGEFAVIALNNDEQDIALLAFRRLSEITRDPEEKCRASFQSAELLIKQNRPEEALSYYQIVADEFPDSDQADLALFSMATIFETGGSAFRAEIMYEKLVKNYPSRLSSARADLILAGQEVKNNELESAIRRLYRVAVTFPRFDEGRKAKEMLNKLK